MKKNTIYVSNEITTEQFIMTLFDYNFGKRLTIIKSSYQFARVDFLLYNIENLKSLVIETKKWNNSPPTFISINKIRNLLKHYHNSFLIIQYETTYYWLYVNSINWENVDIINIPSKTNDTDNCYKIEHLLSNDYSELELQLRLCLIT
jgi:hypothetical protein